MFEEPRTPPGSNNDEADAFDRTVLDLIEACAVEAERYAAATTLLDSVVGDALNAGSAATLPSTLQTLDLVRQEAEGLSRLLRLIAGEASVKDLLTGRDIAACLPLASQRNRVFATEPASQRSS